MALASPAAIAQLAEYARKHPRAYRARVAGLALLGYAYLFAAVALLASIVSLLVFFVLKNFGVYVILKAVLPALVLIWMIGSSLWVRFRPPEGIVLRPGDAPRLMAEIEAVRTAMKAPPIYRVVVDDRFNAGVSEYARLGVFGGYRVYLLIGLPLLAGMPLEEFRSVLAHEFGHVSRAHGRFHAWIRRVERTWHQLLSELNEKNHPAQRIFTRFFRWYAPYFNTYTSVLSRADEFEADAMAERITPGTGGPSQCRIEVSSRYLDRVFWPDIHATARTSGSPPADVHNQLILAVPGAVAHPKAAEWLEEGMSQPTRDGDSHPSTTERLSAMGAQPAIPPAFDTSAAHALLGNNLDVLADGLSRRWADRAREYWAEHHRRAVEIENLLAELEKKAGPLTREEHGERIWLTAELHGDRMAVPLARAFLDAEQEDASVHYLLGRALADENDEEALPHLERAISLDGGFTQPACSVAAHLLHRRGRDEEAEIYLGRWHAYERMMVEARHERSVEFLSPSDPFLPHGLDADQLAAVHTAVSVPGVRRAYVVRKRMRHFPEEPTYLVGLVLGGLSTARSSNRLVQAVLDTLSLPGTSIVLVIEGSYRRFGRAFRQVHAAEVFRSRSLIDRVVRR